MSWVMRWFTSFPYVVLGVAVSAFVLTCRLRRTGKAVWTVWLLVCCSKYLAFDQWGGHAYHPELPEILIWIWNWAYYGAMILAILSILLCWWRSRRKAWLLPLVAWTASAVGVWNGIRPPEIRNVTLAFANLPSGLEGYRIAQIADLHCSSMMRRWRTQAVVDLVNAQRPDIVCLLGDNADGDMGRRMDDLLPLRGLRARDGVWAVTGNHEYFYDPERWLSEYERRLGFRFLSNECVFPRKGLALGGVDDDEVMKPKHRLANRVVPDVARAFSAATNGEFRVLMRHRPGLARRTMLENGVDLQLSGHTHGGFMPLVSLLVAECNFGLVGGVHDFDGRKLCISNGVGQTAAIPIRFFTPSEIVVVTLASAD